MIAQRFPSLGILLTPQATLARLVENRSHSHALFGLLALETVIIYPGSIVSALASVGQSPVAALSGLAAVLVHHIVAPALGILGLAFVVSLASRRNARPVSISVATGVLGYTWSPHVVLTIIGSLLARVGLDSALLPHHLAPLASPSQRIITACVGMAPTVWLVVLALRELWRGRDAAAVAQQSQRPWIRLGVLVAFGLVVGVGGALRPALGDSASSRPTAPPFEVHGLNGGTLRQHDLLGSVALVDFWATWCPPCLASMPHMEQLHEELATQGFRLVSVNVESDAPERARTFKTDHDLSFPIYLDVDGNAQRAFAVTSYPTVVLIDRQGGVRKTYSGAVPVEELRAALGTLLAE